MQGQKKKNDQARSSHDNKKSLGELMLEALEEMAAFQSTPREQMVCVRPQQPVIFKW